MADHTNASSLLRYGLDSCDVCAFSFRAEMERKLCVLLGTCESGYLYGVDFGSPLATKCSV